MSAETKFYAVRRADGENIYGEYGFMSVNHADDWDDAEADFADEDDDGDPAEVEYVIVEMTERVVARRTFKREGAA